LQIENHHSDHLFYSIFCKRTVHVVRSSLLPCSAPPDVNQNCVHRIVVIIDANGSRVGRVCVCLFVCLSVFYTISQNSITKLDVEMFHLESWKPICFWVKGQGQEAENCCRHALSAGLLLVVFMLIC